MRILSNIGGITIKHSLVIKIIGFSIPLFYCAVILIFCPVGKIIIMPADPINIFADFFTIFYLVFQKTMKLWTTTTTFTDSSSLFICFSFNIFIDLRSYEENLVCLVFDRKTMRRTHYYRDKKIDTHRDRDRQTMSCNVRTWPGNIETL